MKNFVVLLLLSIILFGCQKEEVVEISRQEKFINANPQLSEETKNQIRIGTVTVGMTEGEVRASWGDPIAVEIFNSGENSYKRWKYNDGKPVLYWKDRKVYKMDKE